MTNYSVYYSGASGGFMFYWSLQIALGYDVHDQIDKNWDIKDLAKWKQSEAIEFNNDERINGIRLYCNVPEVRQGDISILLYTDINTQEQLARMKNAYWYYTEKFDIPVDDTPVISYNNVKDVTWPNISKIEDFDLLPQEIKTELIDVFGFPQNLTSIEEWKTAIILNTAVDNLDPRVIKIIDKTDYKFLLQDVINTKFKCVCDALGLKHTKEVEEHIDRWVNLHPENIRRILHKAI